MIAFLKVLFLAVLQGIAEFLPISSSGHLVLAKQLIHFSTPGVTLEIALHAGTLLSVCIFYFATIRTLFVGALKGTAAAWRYLAAILVSMIPCGIVYALFGDKLEEAFENVLFVGPALIFTGLLLLTIRQEKTGEEVTSDQLPATGSDSGPAVTNRQPVADGKTVGSGQKNDDSGQKTNHCELVTPKPCRQQRPGLAAALAIGFGQAVAMLPGVSRSGTTIWVARLLRVPSAEAARFSFLMSVPVIGGAAWMEILHLIDSPTEMATAESVSTTPLWMIVVGAVVAGLVGYASLALLVRMLQRGRFRWFGVYCLVVGVVSTLVFGILR